MADWRLQVNIKNTLNFQKILDFVAGREATVLVGFPSGRAHQDVIRELKTDKDGKQTYENKGSRAGEETAELARQLHYGTASIPARPFLTDALEQNKKKINNLLETEEKKENPNLNKVGTAAVGIIQEFVRSDYYKNSIPNSQKWIEEKGSDTPLIDSSDMINSLTYIVKDKK